MNEREIRQILVGQRASDGAGVRLTRVLHPQRPLDPFLMLDEFNSDQADDYIAGFPPHPHRGFETVTYMIEGKMLHEDHLGNRGLLTSGAVQWMTAGRGIIHSEMPQQEEGRMRGFQLWINLPAAEKMKPPAYQDIAPEQIPVVALDGGRVKVIAGRFPHQDRVVTGPVRGVTTDPLYLDVQLAAGKRLDVPTPADYTALVYVFEGELMVADQAVRQGQLARLGPGAFICLQGSDGAGRALVLAARPIGEPIAQYGPFVMNTMAEVEQAIRDYQNGRYTE
ncbi:MAG: pirin family protein [Xanthomonadaceae bacterium]|nr:pirin family protein [Xanthomonadaceae bacterium]